MKYLCDVIRDLLPLYVDEVCSEKSSEIVREHLLECDDCRSYYEELTEPMKCDEMDKKQQYKELQEASLMKLQHRWKKTKRMLVVIGLAIGGVLVYFLIRYVLPFLTAIGLLLGASLLEKPKVVKDISAYTDCIGLQSDEDYGIHREGQFGIFPENIPKDSEVIDFQYVYYNPFDPQYVAYLTVKYDSGDYRKELERLAKKELERYKGYYSVTGEPDGYDLVAMDADDYQGFCYAMVPETEDQTITYVGIVFCNYFLDLDINEYIPDQYLLKDFNATIDNPYKKKMMQEK